MTRAEARAIRAITEAGAGTLTDTDALRPENRKLHPKWRSGIAYTVGQRVQYGDRLYKCAQTHTSQQGWEPVNTPALWQGIDESHTGTRQDPIPYGGNMALENGKYYSQYGVVYRCFRDTGNPVYHDLSALIGLYVEVNDDSQDTPVATEPPSVTEIPEWVQPNGSNPYQIGDRVSYNGRVWESFVANNVWQPGVYGWNEVE